MPMRCRTRIVLALLLAAAPALQADDDVPTKKHPDGYERRDLEGFTVYAGISVLQQQHDGFQRPPLKALETELNDLKRILHPKIVGILQSIPIWVDWNPIDRLSPGAIARYSHCTKEEWEKVGGDPRKLHNVEIVNMRVLALQRHPGTALQQIIILHEMAHAVQHRLLGIKNPELEAIYQQAMDRKLYDLVNDRYGRRGPAYARTNAAEYFAEISCALLDSCNYFPFNYEQLRGHDPAGFKFAQRVWKEPERFQVLSVKSGTSTNGGKGTTTTSTGPDPRTDTFAERDAMTQLDKLRALLGKGKKADAKKGLEELIRKFPKSDAAEEARDILEEIK
jgi:hypothetical protein